MCSLRYSLQVLCILNDTHQVPLRHHLAHIRTHIGVGICNTLTKSPHESNDATPPTPVGAIILLPAVVLPAPPAANPACAPHFSPHTVALQLQALIAAALPTLRSCR
eukprot:140678-Chlamydomonas_euryale.AAC.2